MFKATKELAFVKDLQTQGIKVSPTFNNWYREWQEMWAMVSDKQKEKVENLVRKDLEKYFANAKKRRETTQSMVYFNMQKLLESPEIKEYFKIIIVVSERGIGKSYSCSRLCEYYAKNDLGKFGWIRSSVKERDAVLNAMNGSWLKDNGWRGVKTSGAIYEGKFTKPKDKKEVPTIKIKSNDKIIGYAHSLYDADTMRSVDIEGMTLAIYDEFSNWRQKSMSQVDALANYIETVARHRNNFNLILCANYRDASNGVLTHLGVSPDIANDNNIVTFDWITRAIIIHIPDNTFKSNTSKKSVSQHFSAANFKTYQDQQGAEYFESRPYTIISFRFIIKATPLFHFKVKDTAFNMFKIEYHDKSIKYVIGGDNWVPLGLSPKINKVVLFFEDTVGYPDHHLASGKLLQKMLAAQKNGEIAYSSRLIADRMRPAFEALEKFNRSGKLGDSGIKIHKIN